MTENEPAQAETANLNLEDFRGELVHLMETNHKGKNTSPSYLRHFIAFKLRSVPKEEVREFIATVNQCVPPSLFQGIFWEQIMGLVDVVQGAAMVYEQAPYEQSETIRREIKKAFENGVTSWEARTGVRLG